MESVWTRKRVARSVHQRTHRVACFTFQPEHPRVSPRRRALYFTCLFRCQLITRRVASRRLAPAYTCTRRNGVVSACTTVPHLHNARLFTDSRPPTLSLSLFFSLSISLSRYPARVAKDPLNGSRGLLITRPGFVSRAWFDGSIQPNGTAIDIFIINETELFRRWSKTEIGELSLRTRLVQHSVWVRDEIIARFVARDVSRN